jgi:hypothetical protein
MQKIAICTAIAQAQIIAAPLLAKRAISRARGQKRTDSTEWSWHGDCEVKGNRDARISTCRRRR